MSPATLSDHIYTDAWDVSRACPVTSAQPAMQTDIELSSSSPSRSQSGDAVAAMDLGRSNRSPANPGINMFMERTPFLHGGIYKQDDIVGQYLAQRAALATSMESFQATEWNYIDTYAGGQSYQRWYQRWYPDPESIRHLHTLHSLLPHIQPERRLNALSGLELDIIEDHTGNIFCRAVPKKMLVLFLGRKVVSKFLHTVQREDNKLWRGLPTRQVMILPHTVASAAAITILVAWMMRACNPATMHSMKQTRVPSSLFAACSLAQTLEMFGLYKDAYRLDVAISQQFLKRPIYAIEVKTLWKCLGESSKYVYGCIKAISSQSQDSKMAEEVQGLAERYPRLYARICDCDLNEEYKPQFGRQWFKRLADGDDGQLEVNMSCSEATEVKDSDVLPLGACVGGPHRTDQ